MCVHRGLFQALADLPPTCSTATTVREEPATCPVRLSSARVSQQELGRRLLPAHNPAKAMVVSHVADAKGVPGSNPRLHVGATFSGACGGAEVGPGVRKA